MFSGKSKVKITITGTEEEQSELRSSVISNSKALMSLENPTEKDAIAAAKREVSSLISEFRRTKNLAALDAAAVLISSYGLGSGELEAAVNEAKDLGIPAYYENINAGILQQMIEYDNFITTLSSWNKAYEEAEELKKRTQAMIDSIEQDPIKAENEFKKIREDFIKTEEANLNDSAAKVSTLSTNIESAKKLREDAINKKSHKSVINRIDKQIAHMQGHYNKELDKAWGNYNVHSLNKTYEENSHLNPEERMAKVKTDHEANEAIKKSGSLLVADLLMAHQKKNRGSIKAEEVYGDARLQQLKAEHLQRQSPRLQSPNDVRRANIAAVLNPVDQPQPVSFNVIPKQQPAVQQPSAMRNEVDQQKGSNRDLDFSFKPEPVAQKPAVQTPAASSQMLLSPAEDKNVKEIGAGMKPHVKYQAPVQEKSEIKEKEIPAVQANKQAVKDAGLDEEELAALRPTKPKAGPAAAQAGAAPGHKHQDSLARNDQGQGHSR
jgi:hypothetical protein